LAVLVNQFDLSRYLNKFSGQRNAPELKCTTFLASPREYVRDFTDLQVVLKDS